MKTAFKNLLFIWFVIMQDHMLTAQIPCHITHLTTENGLPSNGIKGLQWDQSTGFLWIATEAGLVRYNGIGFRKFDVATNPELGSSRIVMLVKNSTGDILMGGEQGNLSRVRENWAGMFFKGEAKAKFNYDHYCAVTASPVLFKKCFDNPWHSHVPAIDRNTVIAITDTSCLSLEGGRLYYYSVTTDQPVPFQVRVLHIRNLFKTGQFIFCRDSSGVFFIVNTAAKSLEAFPLQFPGTQGTKYCAEELQLFWQVGMECPVILYCGNAYEPRLENSTLQCTLIGTGIPDHILFRFAQYSKPGYLFLGSESKGVYIVRHTWLTPKHPVNTSESKKNAFYSLIEIPDGDVMTNDGQIIGDNPSKNDFHLKHGFLNSVFPYADSSLIYCARDSFFMYSKTSFTNTLMFTAHTANSFAFAMAAGDLYFVNQDGIGTRRGDSLYFLTRFGINSGSRLNPVDMVEYLPGRLLIATCEGLLGYDIHTKVLDTVFRLPEICIRCLYKTGDYILIGTYGGGIYIMKNGVIRKLPQDLNGYLKFAHCFLTDNKGYCWISTNNGLFKALLSDLTEAWEKGSPQVYYHYFGTEDGMETTEMNGGCAPCALRLGNGNFSFPTMDGIISLDPAQVNPELPAGNIYIDKIIEDGTEYMKVNKGMQGFPEQTKKVDIFFVVSAWCNKENLYLDYSLDNNAWAPAEISGGDTKISLPDPGYGKHVLTIRKMNGFGMYNYTFTSFPFFIKTPFYAHWWSGVIALLAFGALLYVFFKWRLRRYAMAERKLSALIEQKTMDVNLKNKQLEKNDLIKTRLISIISHDIITPLKFMHLSGKALAENKDRVNEGDYLATITEMAKAAGDMEMLSSQILHWIKYQDASMVMEKEIFSLREVAETITGILRFPASQKNITLNNGIPPDLRVRQYRECIRVIVYNLITNSISFSQGGKINTEAWTEGDRFVIRVTDSGAGMGPKEVENILSGIKIIPTANTEHKKGTGLGYMIIRDLLKMTGGKMGIESEKNRGTSVIISFEGFLQQ